MDPFFLLVLGLPLLVTGLTVGVAMHRRRALARRLATVARNAGLELEQRKHAPYPDLVGHLQGRPVRIQLADDARGGLDVRIALSGAPDVQGFPIGPGHRERPPEAVLTGDPALDRVFAFVGDRAVVHALATSAVRAALMKQSLVLGERTLRWRYGRMAELDPDRLQQLLTWMLGFLDTLGEDGDRSHRLAQKARTDPLAAVRVQALSALCDTNTADIARELAEERLEDGTAEERVVAAAHLEQWALLRELVEDEEVELSLRTWGLRRLSTQPAGAEVLTRWLTQAEMFLPAMQVATRWRGKLPAAPLAAAVLARAQHDEAASALELGLTALRSTEHEQADAVRLAALDGADEELASRGLQQLGEHGLPAALVALDALRERLARRHHAALDTVILAIQQRHGLHGEAGGISLVTDTDAGALSLARQRGGSRERIEQ